MSRDDLTIAIVDGDYSVASTLEATGLFNSIEQHSSKDMIETKAQIIFILGKEIQPDNIKQFLSTYCESSNLVFYKPTTQVSLINRTLLEQNNIKVLPHILTMRECIDKILSNVSNDSYNDNCFLFMGTSSKTGTTTIAQSTAKYLAHKGYSVCYVDASGRYNFGYLDATNENKTTYSLEDIRLKASNNLLSDDEMSQGILQDKNGVFVLNGCKSLMTSRNFSIELMVSIVDRLRSLYTFVIVDAGSPSVSTISLGSLISVSNKFLVTNGSVSSGEDFCMYRDAVLTPVGVGDFKLIYNATSPFTFGHNEQDVLNEKIQSGSPLVSFPYLESSKMSEINRTLLCDLDKKKSYASSIEQLSTFLLECLNLNKEVSDSKFNLFKFRRK